MATFTLARAPGIYKGDYLKELFRRYGDEKDAPPAPALPDWCFGEDDGEVDDDGNAVGQELGPSSSGSGPGKRKKEKLKLVRLLKDVKEDELKPFYLTCGFESCLCGRLPCCINLGL